MPQWARSQSVGRRAPSADRNSPCDSVSLPIGSHGWSPASQHISHPLGAIAQLGERLDRTQEVAGSSPASSTSTEPPADGGGLLQFGGTMKRLSHEQENFAIALTVDAATALTTDLRARLRPALSALEATPAQALPVLPQFASCWKDRPCSSSRPERRSTSTSRSWSSSQRARRAQRSTTMSTTPPTRTPSRCGLPPSRARPPRSKADRLRERAARGTAA